MDAKVTIDSFFHNYPLFRYKKRETILFGGDIPKGVFYITKGYVRSFISNIQGKEFTRRLYKPLDFFPVRSVLNDLASTYSYETLTETEIRRADKEDFINFVKDDYELLYFITNDLLERVDETLKRLEVTIMGNANERVVAVLSFIARGIGQYNKNTVIIAVPFTHQEIATIAGLTRETVTIEMEKLVKSGTITQKDKELVIPDINKLEAPPGIHE